MWFGVGVSAASPAGEARVGANGKPVRHVNDRRANLEPIANPDEFRAISREVAELTVDVV